MRTHGWFLVLGGVALVLGCGGGDGDGSSNDSANRANLRRLYTGMIGYTVDTDEVLPDGDWMDVILPYSGLDESALRRPGVAAGGYGYAFDSALQGVAVNSVASPDGAPLIFESTLLARNAVAAYPANGLRRNGGVLTVYLSSRIDPPSRAKPTTDEVRTQGLANVKGLATGLVLYSFDNDDRFPESRWTDTIDPYVGLSREIIKSPSLPASAFGYAFNEDLLGVATTSLDASSAVPMVFDSDLTGRNATGPYLLPNPPRRGGNNVGYADGHGATLP